MRAAGRLLAALLFVAGPVPAQQLWYQQYQAGLEAAGGGAWEEALGHFEAAAALEPQARDRVRTYGREFLFDYDPTFQRARCLAELGRLDQAREALAAAAGTGVTAPEEIDALAARIVDLSSSTPPPTGRFRVRSTPPGATVSVDGKLLGTTPLPEVELTASRHGVAVTLDGFETWEGRLQIRPDEPVLLEVGLVPLGTLPAATTTEARTEPAGALDPGPPPVGGAGSPVSGMPEGVTRANPGAEESDPNGEDPRSSSTQRAVGSATEGGEPTRGPATATRADAGLGDGAAGTATDGAAAPGEELAPPGPASDPLSSERDGSPARTGAGDPEALTDEPPSAGEGGSSSTPGRASRGAEGATRPGRGRAAMLRPAAAALGVLLGAALATVALLRRRTRGDRHPGERRSLWRLARRDRKVGGYEVIDVLGRGGMATTYRAHRVADGKEVALKIPHESGDVSYPERFLREARLGESLHHPGIVRILDAGEDDGLLYIAMELLPGRTLRQALDDAAEPVSIERGLEIARAVAEALDYAHSKGVVHRDLKPENVMLLPDGGLRVMDFGVAQIQGQPGLTASRFFFGSPVYAAPEMVTPQQADHRADLYSLGIVLWELLEGAPPFFDESMYRLLELHQSAPLPDAAALPRPLPSDVRELLERLCAKRPDDRYATAQDLLVDLDHLLYSVAPATLEGA
ncbi:MAG: protein kinase [Thermoanaerobaculia bacterium]